MGEDGFGGFGGGVDPEAARQAADEILARPEYQPPPESLLLRALRWLLRRLDVPQPEVGSGGAGLSLGWLRPLAWLLLAALVLFVLYHVVRVLARHGWARRSSDEDADDDETDTVAEPARRDTAWDAEAAAHEAAGRWREAVAARYRATVQRLAGSGLVRTRPGSSTGEIRGQLARRLPDATAPFGALTTTFEEVWYGGAQPDATTGDAARRQAEAVLTLVPSAASPPPADDVDLDPDDPGFDSAGADFDSANLDSADLDDLDDLDEQGGPAGRTGRS